MSNSEQHKPLILSSPNHGSRQQPHFLFVVIFVAILAFGTLGYHIIEDWSPFDAFYMTVITLATIGYGETHPLTTEGRVFTVVLIFVGLTLGTFVLGAAWHAIAEAQFNRIFDRRRKMLDKIQKLHGIRFFAATVDSASKQHSSCALLQKRS